MKCKLIFLLLTAATQVSAQTAFNELNTPDRSTLNQPYSEGFFIDDKNLVEKGHGETEANLPNQEALQNALQTLGDIQILLRFSQTKWNECVENPSGNYLTYSCTKNRNISDMLNSYLDRFLFQCVDEALEAQGGGRAQSIHIVHAGITADPRHSPKSLHAENRAIDVKQFKVRLSNGDNRQFTYALTGNRPFYTALRNCWGDRVNRYNQCPLYQGKTLYTGSIGWEDRNHGAHMHLSIPYCVNGRYGQGLYQR